MKNMVDKNKVLVNVFSNYPDVYSASFTSDSYDNMVEQIFSTKNNKTTILTRKRKDFSKMLFIFYFLKYTFAIFF